MSDPPAAEEKPVTSFGSEDQGLRAGADEVRVVSPFEEARVRSAPTPPAAGSAKNSKAEGLWADTKATAVPAGLGVAQGGEAPRRHSAEETAAVARQFAGLWGTAKGLPAGAAVAEAGTGGVGAFESASGAVSETPAMRPLGSTGAAVGLQSATVPPLDGAAETPAAAVGRTGLIAVPPEYAGGAVAGKGVNIGSSFTFNGETGAAVKPAIRPWGTTAAEESEDTLDKAFAGSNGAESTGKAGPEAIAVSGARGVTMGDEVC